MMKYEVKKEDIKPQISVVQTTNKAWWSIKWREKTDWQKGFSDERFSLYLGGGI